MESVTSGALRATGRNWLNDAEVIMLGLGITDVFGVDGWRRLDRSQQKLCKAALKAWKHRVVLPAIWRTESEWFYEQLAKLNNDGLIPYIDLLPLRRPWSLAVRWAPWGSTMWRFYRAWCISRVTGSVPMMVWGRGEAAVELESCSLCGLRGVGLWHILVECRELLSHRVDLPHGARAGLPAWALESCESVPELELRVRYTGLCLCAVICGYRR